MKFSALPFLALLFVSSCVEDPDNTPACTQADLIGTYTGTRTCNDQETETVTLEITDEGPGMVKFRYRFEDGTTLVTSDPIPTEGCGFSIMNNDSDDAVTIAAILRGDELTITETPQSTAPNPVCTNVATRN